jgi:hypothetical protein
MITFRGFGEYWFARLGNMDVQIRQQPTSGNTTEITAVRNEIKSMINTRNEKKNKRKRRN